MGLDFVLMEEKREVVVEYQLQAQDVYRAFRPTADNVIRWALALMLAYTFYNRYRADGATVRAFEGGKAIVAIIAVLTIFILTGLVVCPYLQVRARFRKSNVLRSVLRAEFRDEGVRLANAVGTTHLKWSAFNRATETRLAFSLGSGTRNYVFLPKRSLTAEDVTTFRRIIRENLKGKLRLRAS